MYAGILQKLSKREQKIDDFSSPDISGDEIKGDKLLQSNVGKPLEQGKNWLLDQFEARST